jgi:signal transduction histidine kinase
MKLQSADDEPGQDAVRGASAVEERNRELERLQRLQQDLLRLIVHDLLNPISVVQANMEYALGRVGGSPGSDDLADVLRDADEAALRLQRIAEDLLLVAKDEDAALPVLRSRIAVWPLLDEVRRRHLRTAEERRVTLDVVVDAQPELFADKALLARALDNLVDNAVRFTPRGGRIEVAAHINGEAVFTVSNTGHVVPPEERERLFEKFARVGGAGGRIESVGRVGPGIGLYFCRRAAEAHGGRIALVETEEWPARFVMRLPPPAPGRA